MGKKSQVYLSALIAYLIAGFSGAIYSWIHSYWAVFALAALVTAFTLMVVINRDTTTLKETMFEWISVCSLLAIHIVYTILIELAHLSFSGFFVYSFYAFQIVGMILVGYSIVKFVLDNTDTVEVTKNVTRKIFKKKDNKRVEIEKTTATNDVAEEIETTIAEETTTQDAETETSDVEVVGAPSEEETPATTEETTDVVGIELQEANSTNTTPYMEEEVQ